MGTLVPEYLTLIILELTLHVRFIKTYTFMSISHIVWMRKVTQRVMNGHSKGHSDDFTARIKPKALTVSLLNIA